MDVKSANLLAKMLGQKGIESLAKTRKKFPKSVLICGGGSSLGDELSSMNVDRFVVSADAATSQVADAGIAVDMIVTDLDGIVEDQISLNSSGAVAFIHAHGDNQPALERYASSFVGPVIGTCQCPPPQGLFNFGGFTDGDRAACICADLGASDLLLAGFDFDRPSEKLGRDAEVKRRKLQWAKVILQTLAESGVKITYPTP